MALILISPLSCINAHNENLPTDIYLFMKWSSNFDFTLNTDKRENLDKKLISRLSISCLFVFPRLDQ